MRYILPERTRELARIAELLGERVSGVSAESDAQSAVSAVERLREQIGIPARIRDLGGREAQLPEFAAKAFAIKRLMVLTPREVTEADVLAIYREAW
jgi:alcohol dehydrogenase class IV